MDQGALQRLGGGRGMREEVARLRALVRELEVERERERRRRRRNLLLAGIALSAVVHGALLIYLGFVRRSLPSGAGAQPIALKLAVITEEQLTRSPQLDPNPTPIEAPLNDLELVTPPSPLAGEVPSEALAFSGPGAVPTLGAAGPGAGGEGGLGGGAGSTSFFGISSEGTRFAYIVDRSASMMQREKMVIAKRELARSVDSLPDYASFHVVLFSDGHLLIPSTQREWIRARKDTVRDFIRWLDQSVTASGGTVPRPAFEEVFALSHRPDVIFFMTDGEIIDFAAEEVAMMNRMGRHVVINTIAFGDPSSQDLLKQIASDSGGVYRFVPSDGW